MKRPANVFLETERLVLRRLVDEDAELLFALDSDPEVRRYVHAGPPDLERIRREILPRMRAFDAEPGEFGFFAAEEKTTHAFVGWFCLRPEDGALGTAHPEVGFRLRRSVWGRGLATEGVRALVERAFASPATSQVVAVALVENGASLRVLDKAGFRRVEEFVYQPPPSATLPDGGNPRAVRWALSRERFAGGATTTSTRGRDLRRLGGSSVAVTPLGFGSAALGNLYARVPDRDASSTVEAAFDEGIRYFDTAPYYGYGLAERRLGEALAHRPEESVVVSSKVGRLLVPRPGAPRDDQGFVDALPFDPVFDYSYDGVMRSVEESLQRLGRDRIDVLLLHDVGRATHGEAHDAVFEEAMTGGYRALDELRRTGAAGAIGLGVNECAVCLQALGRGDFDCFLVAGRYTLLDRSAGDVLLPRCAARGVSVIVGGPFNSGILASDLRAGSTYDYAAASDALLDRARAIDRVCRAHGVPLATAALRYPLRHPSVASVIPGARSALEVRRNAESLRQAVPESLWDDLDAEDLLSTRSSP